MSHCQSPTVVLVVESVSFIELTVAQVPDDFKSLVEVSVLILTTESVR
jgi:hypothetical protein